MIIDELLFTSSEQLKIEVFKTLSYLKPGSHRIEDLMKKHYFNYHQMTKILFEIEKDVEHDRKQYDLMTIGNGKVELHPDFPKMDEYRQLLCKYSVPYRIIVETLVGGHSSVEDIGREYNVSRSTVNRRITPMIKYLAKKNITLKLSPIRLFGNEGLIRHFYGNFFWLIYRDEHLNMIPVDEEEVKKEEDVLFDTYLFPQSDAIRERVGMIARIAWYRKRLGYKIQENTKWKDFFKGYLDGFEDLKEKEKIGKLKCIPEGEQEFWFYTSYYVGLKSDKYSFLSYQLENSFFEGEQTINSELVQIAKDFFNHLEKKGFIAKLHPTTSEHMFRHVVSILLAFVFFQGDYISLEDLVGTGTSIRNRDVHTKIKEMVATFYDETPILQTKYSGFIQKQNFIDRTALVLYRCLVKDMTSEKKIKLGLFVEAEQYTVQNFVKRLLNHKIVELEDFKHENADTYDVIISTSSKLLHQYPDIHGVQWEIDNGEDEFFTLAKELVIIHRKRSLEFE